MKKTAMKTVGFIKHNHKACIKKSVSVVEARCKEAGLHLTFLRRRVLEILLAEHRAMGAYDILNKLHTEGLGSQPPVAYRAINFLVENGFAHKVERLNAFIACAYPGRAHAPIFFICRVCHSVAEGHSQSARGSLGRAAYNVDFKVECAVVEARGVCPNCQ